MNIVIFTHPEFLGSLSMPKFANMIAEGMRSEGHQVSVWQVKPRCYNLPFLRKGKKWLGYLDQYVLFPLEVKKRLKACPADTLFVFTDHALGPWIPLVKGRPHVVHCHDFLAQQSSVGEIAENPVSLTGRLYQSYIRQGYRQAENFISVSYKTREDLHRSLSVQPKLSEVVYNGLGESYFPRNSFQSRSAFGRRVGLNLSAGYILHVGGNQWYKNRTGVIEIYNAWRAFTKQPLLLLLIGRAPSVNILNSWSRSAYKNDIHILPDISDEFIPVAYSGSTVLLYPSLAEGFGWPIAEAMASGTLVITTDEAPMTEVAGDAAFLIPRKPRGMQAAREWATDAAGTLDRVVSFSDGERQLLVSRGISASSKFGMVNAIGEVCSIYTRIVEKFHIKCGFCCTK